MLNTSQLMNTLGSQDPIKKKKCNGQEAIDVILTTLKEYRELTALDIAKHGGLPIKVVRETLTKLIKQGRVTYQVEKRSRYMYSIPFARN